MTEVVATEIPSPARAARARRRWPDRVLTLVCVSLLASLLAVVGGKAAGFAVLVDHSDSMKPAISAGDVLVTRVVAPTAVQVGDVVSFRSPQKPTLLITHRVTERRVVDGAFAFVTRGDANTGVERWSVPPDGELGRLTLRLPKVGYALVWAADPLVRLILVLGAGVVLAGLLVRRVWTL